MTLQNKNNVLSSYEAKADRVAEIARVYAYRRRHKIAHTGHTVHRLEAAVSALLDRPPGSDAERAGRLLTELRALVDAVQPLVDTSESVATFGPAYERARRAIAKAEGRYQARTPADLPSPEPLKEQPEAVPLAYTRR